MTGPPLLVWRLAVAVAVATVACSGLPVAAVAHGGTGPIPDAAFYRTELSAVTRDDAALEDAFQPVNAEPGVTSFLWSAETPRSRR